ncbi:DUF2252 domain-containing protein [Lentzea tibetensis]|uniref:DUF2252 domain-containing protein n=1 Tax=Lentzea tibetensis TaxID=2591470 RepID=A0A563EPN7_9PSEU|nr:DUF2252 domain-containing protein [Lentzea tibetensis]TWP49452.1 DUF2252 domain-containing protein [Lentzea tibetensis]
MTRATGAKAPEKVPLTRHDRVAQGKAARAAVPRASHAEFDPGPDRPDPLSMLEMEDKGRVQELVPIRYGRMVASPFAYYRGAALPMASDLAHTPNSGLTVQCCGDAHLSNFGLFGSPERRLVFDINDFDETLPGPWEWDIKRLATSMEIAGRNNDFTAKTRRKIVLATVAAYRRAMREFADRSSLAVWYAHLDMADIRERLDPKLHKTQRKGFDRAAAKAQSKDHLGTLSRFAGLVDGEPRIIAQPPLVVPVAELLEPGTDAAEITRQMSVLLRNYRSSLEPERRMLFDQYRFTDLARKVVGVGSVGTRSWMILMLGDDARDPLFLQAKEAGPSALEEFTKPSEFDNAGQRVVVGQRLMQAVSDIFLGWVRVKEGLDGRMRDFYVRQLRDWKGSATIETMPSAGMELYGELCGWTLARAHARTGDRIAIAAYLGAGDVFDQAVREFADTCADQNERDHAALVKAIDRGRMRAAPGL